MLNQILDQIIEQTEGVIKGKRQAAQLALCCLLGGGHALIEDAPGVGKTSLAHVLARSFGCSYRRIQFTPDVLPSDITGFSMYNQKKQDFEYREGALMAQIVLADEINRASPKTQSSLLEAMEERNVTVDGVTHALPSPFIVLATQNPVEFMGTYPLPEAQLDRFMLRITMGYPTREEEIAILDLHMDGNPEDNVKPLATAAQLLEMQQKVRGIHLENCMKEYIVELVRHTRQAADVLLGASPRATIALGRAAQAWAFYNGRDHVQPDDIQFLAQPVLAHRVLLKPEAKRRATTAGIVAAALEDVNVPV